MTTYVSTDPTRHPWFGPPTLKRKHSDPDSDGEGELSEQVSFRNYPMPPATSADWHVLSSSSVLGNHQERSKLPYHIEEASSDADSSNGTRRSTLDGLEKKRRRYDAVERRMARMSLEGNGNGNSNIEVDMIAEPLDNDAADTTINDLHRNTCRPPFAAPPISASLSVDSNASSNYDYVYTAGGLSPVSRAAILSQYAVEEPSSPEELRTHTSLSFLKVDAVINVEEVQAGNDGLAGEVTEVKMDRAEPVWYERSKDRIVITDVEAAASSEDEEEYRSEAEAHPDSSEYGDCNGDFSISSVLMDHIIKKTRPVHAPDAFSLPLKQPKQDGALILYHPPPAFGVLPSPSSKQDEPHLNSSTNGLGLVSSPYLGVGEDDAMDIDP